MFRGLTRVGSVEAIVGRAVVCIEDFVVASLSGSMSAAAGEYAKRTGAEGLGFKERSIRASSAESSP